MKRFHVYLLTAALIVVFAPAESIFGLSNADAQLSGMCRDYQAYIRDKCFDRDGVMIVAVDRQTFEPFTQAFWDTQKGVEVWHGRADYVQYEDSWAAMGFYLDMLRDRYAVTQAPEDLAEIERIARLCVQVFEDSQRVERGFWKRLYGGLGAKRPWEEPLGTDQHFAIVHGLWRVYDVLPESLREKVKHAVVESLLWYMRQGYRYLYVNALYHNIEPVPAHLRGKMAADFCGPHALSYYIPALLWCHELTRQKRFIDDYHWMIERYVKHATPQEHEQQFSRWVGLFMAYELAPAEDKQLFDSIMQELMPKYMDVMVRIAENNGIGPSFERWLEPDWSAVMEPNIPHRRPEAYEDVNIYSEPFAKLRYAPLTQVKDMLIYAGYHPECVDREALKRILLEADSPSHFVMYYDPTDAIMPEPLKHLSRWMHTWSYVSWAGAYWKLRLMGAIEGPLPEEAKTQPNQRYADAVHRAIFSWGDYQFVYGPGTAPGYDDPQGVRAMFQRLRGRGFNGVYWRTDEVYFDCDCVYWNYNVSPPIYLVNITVNGEGSQQNMMGNAVKAAEKEGLEFWAWHTSIYSNGAPPSMDWALQMKFLHDHPEYRVQDRAGNFYYSIPEYAYEGAREAKVGEFEFIANRYGVRNFYISMRSEAAQFQPFVDHPDRFGFNPPIVEAMSEKYGVNILEDPRFDVYGPNYDPADRMVENWRILRGTYLTQLYREIRQAMDAIDPDIRLAVAIPGGDYLGPHLGNMHLDWRTWVDEKLFDELILYVPIGQEYDPDLKAKPYLTDLAHARGIHPVSVFRDYIAQSRHPEIKLISAGRDPQKFIEPPTGFDGWRVDISYDSYYLAWHQRWGQWKQDLKDFGHIKYIEQDFDDFPVGKVCNNGGWGDARYHPELRSCPGFWYPLGDGSDYRAAAQSRVRVGTQGNALKITRGAADPNYGYQMNWGQYVKVFPGPPGTVTTWKVSALDRSNSHNAVDNPIVTGKSSFEFCLYRHDSKSAVQIQLRNSHFPDNAVGLTVEPRTGNVVPLHSQRTEPAYRLEPGQWEKFVFRIDLDKGTYALYGGRDGTRLIAEKVVYLDEEKHAVSEQSMGIWGESITQTRNMFDQIYIEPLGGPGNTSYLDQLLVTWVPNLYFAEGRRVLMSEDFESYPTEAGRDSVAEHGRHSFSFAGKGTAVIENDLSFAEGVKSLALDNIRFYVKRDIFNTFDSGQLLVDLDIFVPDKQDGIQMLPYTDRRSGVNAMIEIRDGERVHFGLKAGENNLWQVYESGDYVNTGIQVAYDTWTHIQMVIDIQNHRSKIIIQPVGSLPEKPVEVSSDVKISSHADLVLSAGESNIHHVCIDNLVLSIND